MNARVTTAFRLWGYSFGVLLAALFILLIQPSRADAIGCCIDRMPLPAGGFRFGCMDVARPESCQEENEVFLEQQCVQVQGCEQFDILPLLPAPPPNCCVNRVPIIGGGFRNECDPVARRESCEIEGGNEIFFEEQCVQVQGCPQAVAPQGPPGACASGFPCLWQGLEQCLGDQKRVRNLVTGELTTNNVCGICEILQLVTNALRMLFAFVGGLALVMVVIGAFRWVASRGNEEAIEAGQKTMVGALIGIALVLGAWTLVNFLIIGLGGSQARGVGQVFGKPWNIIQFCEDKNQPQ
ncbi:MAG: pilin [bacterium]|nr:pilin [bacterium]